MENLRLLLISVLLPAVLGTSWQVTEYTTSISKAGTDAAVYIAIYGERGWSQAVYLNEDGNDHEQGSVDRHTFTTDDLGRPIKLLLWHNNHYAGAGWHVAKIVLWNRSTNTYYTFNAHRWLATTQYDGSVTMEMEVNFWPLYDDMQNKLNSQQNLLNDQQRKLTDQQKVLSDQQNKLTSQETLLNDQQNELNSTQNLLMDQENLLKDQEARLKIVEHKLELDVTPVVG